MRTVNSCVPRLLFGLVVLLSVIAGAPVASAATPGIVIAQVYGAGGLSGANYRQDFITLFNPTAMTVTANAYAIQIRSAATTAAFTVYQLPPFSLKPGQYYLITASSPTLSTYGAVLPVTADYLLTSQFPGPAVSTLNILSSTAQTIALTSTTAQIPTGDFGPSCPALTASNVLDVIGYGATGCFEGTNPASDFTTIDFSPSGYTAARSVSLSRTNRCIDTNDNSVDFVLTPLTAQSFQNSSTAVTPCPGTQLLSTASVSPGVVYPGSSILFTAAVTPATGPVGSISSVSVNLQGIGGSTTQAMYDDGTHGDAVAGDGVYSFSASVSPSSVAGTHVPDVTVTDNQGNTSLAVATFVVTTNKQTAAIDVVQAGAPTNAANNGVVFTVTGIVTGVRSHGFYLQTPDSAVDSDPFTSEAIYVNTGVSAPPASVVVGNQIQVTGVLTVAPLLASPSSSAAPYNGTELDAPTAYSVISSGNPLPAPIAITPQMAAAGSTFGQRYQYQSMLVSIPSVTAVSGTSGILTESNETYVSDGRFYGVVNGTPRPFREAGLSLADPIPAGGPGTVQNFDGNPEALAFDSMSLGGGAIDLTTGTSVSNVVAIDDYSTGAEQLLLSATSRPTIGTPGAYSPALTPESNEFTVGTQSMQRFYSSTPATGAVTLTSEAYQRRVAKSSLSIRKSLLSPDILAVQEVGTIATLTDLANKINSDAVSGGDATQPHYVPYLTQGNDAAALNNGLLVNSNRVTVNSVAQLDKTALFTDAAGSSQTLFDDPPLALDATVNATASTAAYPVLVLSVEFASSFGETGSTIAGQTLRLKRQQQAQAISAVAQSYRSLGKNVIVAGNMGAPEFSDGVVDVVGLIKGTPAASANVVLGASSTYTAPSPALVDLTQTAPAQDRYSTIQYGSAEAMDHIIVTPSLAGGYMVFAHDNVDFPAVDRNDATRPERNSDHDGAVAYFMLPDLTLTSNASITPNGVQDFGNVPMNTASQGQVFTFTNTGNVGLANIVVSSTGDFVQTNNCSATLAVQASCSINLTFTPSAIGPRSGTLTIASSSTVHPTLSVSLTGTGTTAPVTTLSLTPASADFGTVALEAYSSANIFLLTNTGQTAITGISIATSGDYTETTSCGATLAPCSSCSINVIFAPTASGKRNGSLTVSSNSTSTPKLTSTLTGQGATTLTTTATVLPTSHDFGTVNSGTTSPTATVFTFTNTGTASMTNLSVATTSDFAQTNTCGFFLNPGDSCTISVNFHPVAAGARAGTLSVTSGSVLVPSISTIATLTGNGFVATNGASLSPASQNFGTIVLGSSSTPVDFTFTNIGTTALSSVAVAISGAGFAQTNNCTASMAAGASCDINAVYTPGAPGTSTGTITVTSSSTTNPSVSANLTGAGAAVTSTVTIAPGSQDFGSVTLGATSDDFNFNFKNTGNTDITGVTVSVSGPFGISATSATGGNNCSTTISPGTSCTITLTFNPTAVGASSGSLTIASSSTTSPTLTVALTGMGVGTGATDTVTLTPVSQDFGAVTVGAVSSDVLFTFANTGTTAVSGVAVSMSGPYKLSTTGGTNCGSTLAAGTNCTIDVVFVPTAPGAATGVLTVASSSSTGPAITSALTGTGLGVVATDTVTLTPTSKDFGSATVGSNSTDMVFTFANTGTISVSGVGISMTGPFKYSPASGVGGTNCGATLAAGANCSIDLVFSPTATGAASGVLTVVSSSSTTPTITSALTGTGVGVVPTDTVTLTPTSKDFGSTTVGSVSSDMVFTFANTGTTSVSGVAVSMTGPYRLSTTGGTTCGATVAAGASCTIDLVFAPTASGAASGVLRVASSSSISPTITSALTGTGVAALPTDTVTLTPASQGFGSVAIGSVSPNFVFTFSNTGTASVSGIGISMTGPFRYSTTGGGGGTTCGSTLAAGASCTITLVFAPTAATSATGVLTVVSSSSTSPTLTSALTGTGTTVPTYSLTATTTTATIAAGSPVSLSLNVASVNSYVGTVNLSCTGAPTYSTCQVSPTSVTLTANGTTSETISITTSVTTPAEVTVHPSSLAWMGGLSLGLLFLMRKRGRRLLGTSLVIFLWVLTLTAVGCGGGTTSTGGGGGGSTTHTVVPGTYTYTVTATDGTSTKTLPFTVTVQ